jgi:hypothetical protein
MTLLPRGVKVHLALGFIDMRKGIDGLAMLVQGVLQQDPFSGHLFVFRGRKANLIKTVYWDGNGLCLFTKLNGTSSVLYGTVPELAPGGGAGHSLFLHLCKRFQRTRADCLWRNCRPLQSDIWRLGGRSYGGAYRAFALALRPALSSWSRRNSHIAAATPVTIR